MNEPLRTRMIPETFVQLLYEYLDARGMASEHILGQARPVLHTHSLGSVPIERWAKLLERASRHLDDPLLGLHLGQTIAPRHLGVLGYLAMACDNLGAALLRLEHYQRLIFDFVPMTQRIGPDYVDLVWDMTDCRPGALVDENGITVLVQFCRSMTGVPESPLLVQFPNPPPSDIQPYLDWFGCPVQFAPEQNEIVVRVSFAVLMLPLKSADPGLIAAMEHIADQLLAQLPKEDMVIELVRNTIVRLLYNSDPDIETVAAKLNCASRTLQRQLKSAGSSFRQELTFVRRQLADSYLRDPSLSIADIALLLGYSEHSVFSRGYKEWTGMSPQQFRQHLGGDASGTAS